MLGGTAQIAPYTEILYRAFLMPYTRHLLIVGYPREFDRRIQEERFKKKDPIRRIQ